MTSQRKLRPVYKNEQNGSNLGRSKSTIIKPVNHRSYEFKKGDLNLNYPYNDLSEKKKQGKVSRKKSSKSINQKKQFIKDKD